MTCEAEITQQKNDDLKRFMPEKTTFNLPVEVFLWSVPPINKMLTFSSGIYLRRQRAVKIDIEGSAQ